MKEFAGKVALVTGTTGIGCAIAKRFAAASAQVIACGIDAAANEELTREAEELHLTLLVEHCDVTNVDRMRAVIAQAVSRHGGLDIIVNAAAIHPFGTVVETDLATWNRCMMVNVGSIYLLAHLGIPEMKKRGGGSIINLASVQGYACQRGDSQPDARLGPRPRRRQYPRQFDQPRFDPHPDAGTLRGAFRARSADG